MIMTRDIEIVEFLQEFKVARTSTIQNLFFPSLQVTQRRLTALVNEKQIKRLRDSTNYEYIYYYKKMPKQIRHRLLVTEFYKQLKRKYEQVTFKVEPVYDRIRPDAVFGYINKGIGKIGLMEVELSNKGFDWNKYDVFYSGDYKKFLSTMPFLCIISDKVSPTNYERLKHRGVETVIIKTDMNNFRLP